jgi:hypothetical protein
VLYIKEGHAILDLVPSLSALHSVNLQNGFLINVKFKFTFDIRSAFEYIKVNICGDSIDIMFTYWAICMYCTSESTDPIELELDYGITLPLKWLPTLLLTLLPL